MVTCIGRIAHLQYPIVSTPRPQGANQSSPAGDQRWLSRHSPAFWLLAPASWPLLFPQPLPGGRFQRIVGVKEQPRDVQLDRTTGQAGPALRAVVSRMPVEPVVAAVE